MTIYMAIDILGESVIVITSNGSELVEEHRCADDHTRRRQMVTPSPMVSWHTSTRSSAASMALRSRITAEVRRSNSDSGASGGIISPPCPPTACRACRRTR